MSKENRKEKNKKGLWWKILLGIVMVAVVSAIVYTLSIYNTAKNTVETEIHSPTKSIDTAVGKEKVEDAERLNILLLGVDERKGDKGRSDALLMLSLNPKTKSIDLVSIPRDTRTEIIGKGVKDKINHAYAFGGTDMSVATVENFLDIELDYYVKVNMEGLAELVDTVGGITVQNKTDWYDEGYYKKGYHYAKGELQLNGAQTIGYVRMRHFDSDFARTGRQRQVIEAIIDQGASVASVTKINSFINVLGNNVTTNLDFEDMKNLMKNYRNTRNNINSYQMKGEGTYIENSRGQDIYYLVVPDEEVSKVHDMLKKS
ncbi:LCP family glycopolymer transferase [Gracilibacillus sp. D59]|uniref:LCP family glycopolymer transferase n=1 Tax=Gracilibacillus sp. D59 TaxID=3457434 RepID=UPI003FCDF117